MLLAGDIGGTKTVLALFSTTESTDTLHPLHLQTYPSGQFSSLEAIIAQFLQNKDVEVEAAAFGVAGPVVNGRSQITNLPWVIDAAVIGKIFHIDKVTLLNDLESIATAVPHLQANDLAIINEGKAEPGGAIAVIAPGTGLGEAFLIWNGQRYQAHPSEGGHASFAPTNPDQCALQSFLGKKFEHISFERVCSGSGIPNLYAFWRHDGRFPEPDWLREQIDQADDPTPIIVEAGLAKTADICTATVEMFVDILAGEASNMALKVLSTGGVFLGGGIPPRLLNLLQTERFISGFSDKGRFTNLLRGMPLQVICNPQTALLGAAWGGWIYSMPERFSLHILPTPEQVNQFGVELLIDLAQKAVAAHGRFTIALSGGGTPAGIYQLWGKRPYRDQMPWQQTHLFWGDERLVPPDDPGSNYKQIADLLLPHVPIPPENVHRAKGELDSETAVADYLHQLQPFAAANQPPVLDVILLGMGSDGHTASLFPGSPVQQSAWVVGVTAEYDGRPAQRISLTPTVINQARHIIFLVTGTNKAATLQNVLYGPHQPDLLPAQRIQPTNGTLTWLLDTAVAQNLTDTDKH